MLHLKAVNDSHSLMSDESIRFLTKQYDKLKAEYKRAEELYKQAEKQLKAIMENMKADELRASNGQVLFTYKGYERTSFDSKSFQKDHADLYNQYTKILTVKATLKRATGLVDKE